MTTVTYFEGGIRLKGHAKDPVVCHGISAISQMAANYVVEKGWGEVLSGDGYLEIKNVQAKYWGNDLFRAVDAAFRDIKEAYPGNLQIKYR